ncbi:MAG TPA: hypothetical protein VJ570_06565 [Holophagaceae bacterium]|nr:hypothetical protein [Holophagaceae bacterium]
MVRRHTAVITLLATGLVAQALPQEDPVMRARAQRAALSLEGDLPPVPRGVIEPPPLPPPDTHPKDLRGGRGKTRSAKGKKGTPKSKSRKGGKAKAPRGAKAR